MSSENQVLLTESGAKKLKEELNNLINFERPKVIESLVNARAQGDLKENADYSAARDRQSEIESRIKEIENILANSKIVVANNGKTVSFGSKVTIKIEGEKKEEIYYIVSSIEADPTNNKISNESPLGATLMNHKINDILEVRSKTNSYKLKIINIEK